MKACKARTKMKARRARTKMNAHKERKARKKQRHESRQACETRNLAHSVP